MNIKVEMPGIVDCLARECSYNVGDRCHAKAITVGDGANPACDTFIKSSMRVKNTTIRGGVGACKVIVCGHNSDLECTADGIELVQDGAGVSCATFRPI